MTSSLRPFEVFLILIGLFVTYLLLKSDDPAELGDS